MSPRSINSIRKWKKKIVSDSESNVHALKLRSQLNNWWSNISVEAESCFFFLFLQRRFWPLMPKCVKLIAHRYDKAYVRDNNRECRWLIGTDWLRLLFLFFFNWEFYFSLWSESRFIYRFFFYFILFYFIFCREGSNMP